MDISVSGIWRDDQRMFCLGLKLFYKRDDLTFYMAAVLRSLGFKQRGGGYFEGIADF